MNITLTDITGTIHYVIPIVPTSSIDINNAAGNNNLDTIHGQIRIMGNRALRTVEWSSQFPVNKNYSFVADGSRSDGWEYVDFLNLALETPIRIVITNDDKKTILNMLATVDSFNYHTDSAEDIVYKIKLTEFRYDIWNITTIRQNIRNAINGIIN